MTGVLRNLKMGFIDQFSSIIYQLRLPVKKFITLKNNRAAKSGDTASAFYIFREYIIKHYNFYA